MYAWEFKEFLDSIDLEEKPGNCYFKSRDGSLKLFDAVEINDKGELIVYLKREDEDDYDLGC